MRLRVPVATQRAILAAPAGFLTYVDWPEKTPPPARGEVWKLSGRGGHEVVIRNAKERLDGRWAALVAPR